MAGNFYFVFIILKLVLSLLSGFSSASISWSFYTKPAVFGDDVELHCQLSNVTSLNETRLWDRGQDRKVIVMNGVSINQSEYSEQFNRSERKSILTIMSLDEKDVNILYTCQHGFETYEDTLKMTVENFEYHPKDSNTTFQHYDKGILFSVTFDKVYPVPECSASYGNLSISDKLDVNVTVNDAFYTVTLYLEYQHVSNFCVHHTFYLVCNVGRKKIVQSFEPVKTICFKYIKLDSDRKEEIDQLVARIGQFLFIGVIVTFPLQLYIAHCLSGSKLGCTDWRSQRNFRSRKCASLPKTREVHSYIMNQVKSK